MSVNTGHVSWFKLAQQYKTNQANKGTNINCIHAFFKVAMNRDLREMLKCKSNVTEIELQNRNSKTSTGTTYQNNTHYLNPTTPGLMPEGLGQIEYQDISCYITNLITIAQKCQIQQNHELSELTANIKYLLNDDAIMLTHESQKPLEIATDIDINNLKLQIDNILKLEYDNS